ncbi:MAG: hypothetical protein J6S67_25185 [Methanobrevibacter sp.]|nr:hypothetical protein [Methanobrevibacter sp.]
MASTLINKSQVTKEVFTTDSLKPGYMSDIEHITQRAITDYTVNGKPTIDSNYIASGFTDSNNLSIPNIIASASTLNSFVLYTKIRVLAFPGSGVNEFFCSADQNKTSVRIGVTSTNQLRFRVSSVGDWSYTVDLYSSTISANTDYYVKATYDSSTGYTLDFSTDGTIWDTQTSSSTARPFYVEGTELTIGDNAAEGNSFSGTIDLKETYIDINGDRAWTAVTIQPVDEYEVKSTLLAGKNVSITPKYKDGGIDAYTLAYFKMNDNKSNEVANSSYTMRDSTSYAFSYANTYSVGSFGKYADSGAGMGYSLFDSATGHKTYDAITVDMRIINTTNSTSGNNGWVLLSGADNTWAFYISKNSGQYSFNYHHGVYDDQIFYINDVPVGTNIHIAVELFDGKVYVYWNGEMKGAVSVSQKFFVDTITPGNPTVSGYGLPFQDLRISNTARYQGEDFDVPTAPYTVGESGIEGYKLNAELETALAQISGYDATKTQTLKNVSGTLTWVDD